MTARTSIAILHDGTDCQVWLHLSGHPHPSDEV